MIDTCHTVVRKLGHSGEDFRYQKFRAYWGPRYWWVSYLQTFVLQSVFAVILSVALLLNVQYPGTNQLLWSDVLGALVWTVGFLCEAVGTCTSIYILHYTHPLQRTIKCIASSAIQAPKKVNC